MNDDTPLLTVVHHLPRLVADHMMIIIATKSPAIAVHPLLQDGPLVMVDHMEERITEKTIIIIVEGVIIIRLLFPLLLPVAGTADTEMTTTTTGPKSTKRIETTAATGVRRAPL